MVENKQDNVTTYPVQVFNGKEYHLYTNERYFSRGANRMHEDVWRYYNGEIPKGYHIHHKDENTWNNEISNLELIEAHEHLSRHMQERLQDEDELQKLHDRMDYARIYANKWHGSPEGIEWHKKHAKEVAEYVKQHPKTLICQVCGKEFQSVKGDSKFCSNKCKSKYRLLMHYDDEERVCVICGKTFTINKYYKAVCCGRECGKKRLSDVRKELFAKRRAEKKQKETGEGD